jgi:hypothetical protein
MTSSTNNSVTVINNLPNPEQWLSSETTAKSLLENGIYHAAQMQYHRNQLNIVLDTLRNIDDEALRQLSEIEIVTNAEEGDLDEEHG